MGGYIHLGKWGRADTLLDETAGARVGGLCCRYGGCRPCFCGAHHRCRSQSTLGIHRDSNHANSRKYGLHPSAPRPTGASSATLQIDQNRLSFVGLLSRLQPGVISRRHPIPRVSARWALHFQGSHH
jgi:hypothetical protein